MLILYVSKNNQEANHISKSKMDIFVDYAHRKTYTSYVHITIISDSITLRNKNFNPTGLHSSGEQCIIHAEEDDDEAQESLFDSNKRYSYTINKKN